MRAWLPPLCAAAFFCWAVGALAQIGPIFPGPGIAIVPQIGTPQSLGSAGTFGGGGASQTINYANNVLSGDTLVACVAFNNAAAVTNTSVSDGTNSYTLAEQSTFGAGTFLNIWYKANAAAVGAGATLTASLSGGMSGTNSIALGAMRVAGLIAASPLDAINQNKASGVTTISTATGTLAQANEIIAGCAYAYSGTATAYSGASGFTNVFSQAVSYPMGMDYDKVAAPTSVTYSPTFNGNGSMYAVVATLKGH
jgi:hypothetical protein